MQVIAATPERAADPALADVTLRRIRASDLAALRQFVHRLSAATGYKRLFSGRIPSDDEMRRWTAIDPTREAALVASVGAADGEQIIGVTRYVKEGVAEAEFAIVLADAWQRRGLGARLLRSLIDTAREDGLRQLSGITLSSNVSMLSIARRMGFRTVRLPDASTTRLVLDITPVDTPTTTP